MSSSNLAATRFQLVAPLPDLPTGIAQYSRDLLDAIDGVWHIDVFGEPGSRPRPAMTTGSKRLGEFDGSMPTVYQIGNSEFHERAISLAVQHPGIVVLHDTVLHHSRFSSYVRGGRSKAYLEEVSELYGSAADEVASMLLGGRIPDELHRFPMTERLIDRSRRVVVHNDFARRQVAAVRPDAAVTIIPMGIPLPAMIDKASARQQLGLPESAFLVATISHINRQKRIPILLRAVRRLVERVQETRLIVAGTPAPGLGYGRLTEMLGLRSRVQMPGYVSDRVARLLAAAADVCVNLRYPSHGETSASLLRLLGAGRPVIVTDAPGAHDLPEGVGLKIPIDRFEEEMLCETLFRLYADTEFSRLSAAASRNFVEQRHTMAHMVDGYRRLLLDEYGLDMPDAPLEAVVEPIPVANRPAVADGERRASNLDCLVGKKLDELGLAGEHSLIDEVATNLVELGLDKLPKIGVSELCGQRKTTVDGAFGDILACPDCSGELTISETVIACTMCGNIYQIRGGVPSFADPKR